VAGEALPPQPPPPPAAEPAPAPRPPAAKPAPPAPPAKQEAPPPLDPPPANEPPPSRPAFLHTADEMERLKPSRARKPSREPAVEAQPAPPEDFAARSSPWVDLTLTTFHLEDRTGNLLNLGVQVGGYVFERLRVSARLVAPLEEVSDGYSTYSGSQESNGAQSFERVKSRSMTLLYAASLGIMLTNSKSFVFAPSVELQRTDVLAYGSAISLALPFEWTTRKNMRVGFEIALGHAFGGHIEDVCRTVSSPATSCGTRKRDRPSGTAVLLQYYMGWSLGRL